MRSCSSDPEHLRDRFDVGDHVVVREHHALGHAGAAAREDDGGERIGVSRVRRPAVRAGQRRARSQRAQLCRAAPAASRMSSTIDGMPSRGFELRFGEKRLRGDDGRMPHCSMADCHGFVAGGEVQVHRNLAGQRDADVGQRAADGGGQQHADHLVAAGSCGAPNRRAADCRSASAP